jgi:hypothetical protein
MTGRSDEVRRTCIDVAVTFVAAQPGGARRVLARHRRLPDGTCGGCVGTAAPWPCTAATVARLAARSAEPGS